MCIRDRARTAVLAESVAVSVVVGVLGVGRLPYQILGGRPLRLSTLSPPGAAAVRTALPVTPVPVTLVPVTPVPVSYTHLDVYKRQALELLSHDLDVAGWSGFDYNDVEIDDQTVPILMARATTSVVSPPVLSGHGLEANNCLLYTSRCV